MTTNVWILEINMIRDGHSSASLFVGTEVEHTPALGLKTLFVVGIQPLDLIDVAYSSHKCEHIYFGANQSFAPDGSVSYYDQWENMIRPLLKDGRLCTLDFDVAEVESVLEYGFSEYNNFIPMISVKLPYIQQLGYNAIIKLDDKDFKASNPGVWCHSVHDLQNRTVFTDWSKYTKDEVIK
jgi:hypothetical protein